MESFMQGFNVHSVGGQGESLFGQIGGNLLKNADENDVAMALAGHPTRFGATVDLDAGGLLHRYRQAGIEVVLNELKGDFSLALLDAEHGRMILAADRCGTHAVYYGGTRDGVVASSDARLVARSLVNGPRVNPQALYNYVFFHVVPGPETIFEGVRRLLPGEFLLLERGAVKVVTYWRQAYRADHRKATSARERELLAVLQEAVAVRAGDGDAVGAFLSGGTDSSTVAGLLGRATGKSAKTYSIGFDATGYDEMEYARIASRWFNTEHHEYYVTPQDVVEAVPRIAAAHDQPFGNASVVPAYYCAAMARSNGTTRLLAGDGGDEIFGGNERYAKQKLFQLYGRVPETLRRWLIEPAAFRLPGLRGTRLGRKMRSYIEQARVPLPERLETNNLLNHFSAARIFNEDFLQQIRQNEPVKWLNETYHQAATDNELSRLLALDMRFVLADSDLPKVNRACQLAGVDVAYPMLDERVVDFAAALPARDKVRGMRLRYFFKRAMRNTLPPEILSKKKQGFGLPFGVWLQDDPQLRQLAGDSLGRLAGSGAFNEHFVRGIIDRHHREHPAYYGVMIWILMVLQQWLDANDLSL